MGDIGEKRKHIELEPVEAPIEVPQPEKVPAGSFWPKVDRSDPDGCWPWTNYIDKSGYGRYSDARHKGWTTHRIAYEMSRGPIPEGLVIDHLCRNRACCNPAHMEAVTREVNTLRGIGPTAVNSRRESCVHGHAFSASNTYIRPSGARDCRTCFRARTAAYRKRKGLA